MAEGAPKFQIPLFDGKMNFMVWKSTIEDLLVQQDLDAALDEAKPTEMNAAKWATIKKKAVSTIRLGLAQEIKYNYLEETDPKELLKKLETVYASKSLTNKLCLRYELYQLRMEENGTTLQDHINLFNQLVCQLKNADEKITDQEEALLLLASLPKSYRPIVQTLLVGRTSITLDQAMAILRENERMMSQVDGRSLGDGSAIAMVESGRGRNHERKEGGQRSSSRSRPRDLSGVECYYCGEKGHIQSRCSKMREDLKSLKQLQVKLGKTKIDDDKDSSNVVYEDGDLYLTSLDERQDDQESWVMDSAASFHVCRDQAMFDTLRQDGEFGHINMGCNQKLKVRGLGSVQMKLHGDVIRTLHNVRFVPEAHANLISLGKLTSQGCRYVGSGRWCKVYRGGSLIVKGKRADNNICYVEGHCIRRSKAVKKVSFSDEVEVFGDLARGRNLLGCSPQIPN